MLKFWKEFFVLSGFIIVSVATNASLIEIVASFTGLLCVWWSAKESIWNYPPGFVNVILFAIIFWQAHLYADMTLQIIFGILMIYGIFVWLTKKGNKKVRPTRHMSQIELASTIILIAGITAVWGFVLSFTPDNVPFLDAFTASLSILAQWFLSKKVLGNWVLWIMVDIFSIGMYIYKGLPVIAFTYVIFLIMATYGYFSWRKVLLEEVETYA